MSRSTRYSPEVQERAVRMVFEHQGERGSQRAAIEQNQNVNPPAPIRWGEAGPPPHL